MDFKNLNPSKGIIVPGCIVDGHAFMGVVSTAQLFHIAPDPRETEDPKVRANNPAIRAQFEVRQEVQRLFEGEKEKNVAPYAEYINKVQTGQPEQIDGEVPTITLFSEDLLETEMLKEPLGYVLIPYGKNLPAIDGETQVAARYDAAKSNPAILGSPVTIKICHGRSLSWARQAFYDLNLLGVQPNAAVALAMDTRDPLTAISRRVETEVPFLKGRINKDRRSLRKTDNSVMTITALRGGVVTLAEGLSGVKYGTGPADIHSSRLPAIEKISIEWFTAITQLLGTQMEDRVNTVAATPPIIAALGAIGHELLNYATDDLGRNMKKQELLQRLDGVDWNKGKAWESIVGKYTAKGGFSVGGTKETVHAVFKALNDPASPEGRQVRGIEQMPMPHTTSSPQSPSVATH
jgi:hypothetical protein